MNLEDIVHSVNESVATVLEVEPDTIDPGRPFEEMGVDSLILVGLSAEFEDRFDLSLHPEIAYEHNTVHKVSRYLYGLLHGGPAGTLQ